VQVPLEEYALAETPEQVERALERLADLDVVGIDVERADWDRYWRAAALVQAGGNGKVVLFDPLALGDLRAFDEFLRPRRTVLHAMENDLGPLEALGVTPEHIDDTAIAAAILGMPTGLEGLLADVLAVELEGDKSAMQRADWERRPMSEAMLRYAAGDVADLPALWEELSRRLDEAGRTEWYEQELEAALALPAAQERRDWTRTKGAGRLDPAARLRLRLLWEAREDLARTTDTAPGRIAPDKLLVDLAVRPVESADELLRRGMRRQAVREHGPRLVAALEEAGAQRAEPVARTHRAVTEQDRVLAERLRVLRAERARKLGIDPGILCPSRTLMSAVLADPADPAALRDELGLRPWQWAVLGRDFSEAMGLEGPGLPPEEAAPDEEGSEQ
jgi:ribonuclease D